MKNFVEMARKSIYENDGFLNGFIKGTVGSAVILVLVSSIAAFH